MQIDSKKVDKLERLIKSLSDMENKSWKFKDWMMFIKDCESSVHLVNELRDMSQFSDKVKENREKREEKVKEIKKKVTKKKAKSGESN